MTACATDATVEDPHDGPLGKGDDPSASHYPANHCEIFVDRAVPVFDSHSFREFNLYLKVLPDRLDAPVARVGFTGVVEDPEDDCQHPERLGPGMCDGVGTVQTFEARSFLGSSDYFSLDLIVGHAFTFEHRYVGDFFVETEAGTTYHLRAPDGGDLYLDQTGIDQLANGLRSVGYDDFFTPIDIAQLPSTASFYPYLNHSLCQ